MIRVFLVIGRVAKTPQPWMDERRFSITTENLPVPDAPRIDVHEIRGWIEPDAADPQPLRLVAQVLELDAGHADVDRLAVHVQAVARPAAVRSAALLQHRIGLGSAVAGNHVERLVGAK